MLFLKLWNYIRGYVIIIVEGYFLEKFMNVCIHRQVFLWDVKRLKNNRMTLKISIKGFRMLRPIAKKTRCRVRIAGKRGIPFIINRYRGRKAFAVGAVLFVVGFYALTSFIWSIEITGNKTLETQRIEERLAVYGVKPGVLKYSVQPNKIVNDLILDIKELAWASVVVKGTKVRIEVAERVKAPERIAKEIPCDIYAAKDGVIKSITVKAGQDMVKAGSTVQKGQLLVSGTVPNKNEGGKPTMVHSIAVIKARTWYEKSATVQVQALDKERTGEKKDQYSLVLFSKRINLFSGSISFEDYDKIEIKKGVSFGEDIVLPFSLIIDRYYENNVVERDINIDDAKKIAAEEAYKEAAAEIPEGVQIVNTTTEYVQQDDGSMRAVVTIECLEDIGVTKEIGGN